MYKVMAFFVGCFGVLVLIGICVFGQWLSANATEWMLAGPGRLGEGIKISLFIAAVATLVGTVAAVFGLVEYQPKRCGCERGQA